MKMKLSIALVLFTCISSLHAYSMLNYNDIYPIFTTKSRFEFMNQEQKEILHDTDKEGISKHIQFTTSMLGQKATHARNLDKVKVLVGDVHGRLNMVGLTYGNVPTGETRPALLEYARTLPLTGGDGTGTLGNTQYADLNQNYGFFSLPVKYHKVGARFNVSLKILDDFVLTFQTGVVDMKQTLTAYTTKTADTDAADVFDASVTTIPDPDTATVERNLMDKRTAIFTQMGINGEDWSKTGVEDVTLSLVWRHNFRVNKDADPEDWAPFIFTPFFRISATLGTGREQDPDILLSLPFGNNKHNALHASSGFSVDFKNSLELIFEGGGTHFFDRSYIARVPTDRLQSLLFPFKTTITNKPGKTWNLSVALNSHHFLDRLSVYAHYAYVQHANDTITLAVKDSAFLPERLEEQTRYKNQMATIGFNYDLSPNMSCGFAWQAPLVQRGSYKTSTILLSGVISF